MPCRPSLSLECLLRSWRDSDPPCDGGKLFRRTRSAPLRGLWGEGGIAVEVVGRPEPGLALLLAARSRFELLGGVTLPLVSCRGILLPAVRKADVGGDAFARDAAVGLLKPPLSRWRSCVAGAERGGWCAAEGDTARFAFGCIWLDSPIEGRKRFENLAAARPRFLAACCVDADGILGFREDELGPVLLISSIFKPTRGSISKIKGRGSSPEYAKLVVVKHIG